MIQVRIYWMPIIESGRVPYINFQAEFEYRPAFRNPDQFLEILGKPYYVIMYELEDQLNVEALKRWSAERAGLEPSGSQTFNGELESIDYNLFRGRLRISAQKFTERTSESGGKLTAIAEPTDAFRHAHSLIRPEHLIGFIVGDIAPKAMMHLVQMSRRSTSA